MNQSREFSLRCGWGQQSDGEAGQGPGLDVQMALHPAWKPGWLHWSCFAAASLNKRDDSHPSARERWQIQALKLPLIKWHKSLSVCKWNIPSCCWVPQPQDPLNVCPSAETSSWLRHCLFSPYGSLSQLLRDYLLLCFMLWISSLKCSPQLFT